MVAELRSGDGAIIASLDDRPPNATYEQIVEISRTPLRLVNRNSPQGRELPIQQVERIEIGNVAYSEYVGKYALVGANPKNGKPGWLNSDWPEGLRQPVYLMDRNGNVEVVAIPNPRTWNQREWTIIDMALPSATGMVFAGSHGCKGGGLFVYDGKQVETVDIGQVRSLAVTPDGCKVAWAIINDYGHGLLDHRIKYMNVCQGGN